MLQTRNIYDRIQWLWAFVNPANPQSAAPFSASEGVTLDEKNPSWGLDHRPMPTNDRDRARAGYKAGFTGFGGTGSPSSLREIHATIPIARIKDALSKVGRKPEYTDNDLCFVFGITMYFGTGPATRTLIELGQAYSKGSNDGHQYGYGATSSPAIAGRVKFSPEVLRSLGMRAGETMKHEEFWKQDVPDRPPNNLELPFPADYPTQNDSFAPLVPTRFLDLDKDGDAALEMSQMTKETQLKLQTRIESEATLKIADKETLASTVLQLHLMGMGDKIDTIMRGDPLLEGFRWSLTPTEELVFTDEYMDDSKLTALKSGIGIRKRRSSTASKLNVKTGQGYRVHQPTHDPKPGESYPEDRDSAEVTDIFRRHEVGFSLNPEATPEQIGKFLGSGVEGEPWNLGANEATSGITHEGGEGPINFSELAKKMVLMGYRRKFNLKAVPKSGQGTINIEISCDHTVGCRPDDVPLKIPNAEGFQQYFKDMDGRFQERFNVEMELEHLGAGGATPSQESSGGARANSMQSLLRRFDTAKYANESKPEPGAPKAPPQNFPAQRPYQRRDADNEKFNTQSFSVFYAAHKRVIGALRHDLKGNVDKEYLQSDRQKLETLRDALKLVGDPGHTSSEPQSSSRQPRSETKPTPEPRKSTASIQPDGNCLYNAVIASAGLGISAQELRAFATQLLIDDAGLLRKLTKYGSDVNRLIGTICTDHTWNGDEGDLVPVVVAQYIRRPICVYVVAERKKYMIQPSLPGVAVNVFYGGNHYEAQPPRDLVGWEHWEIGASKRDSDEAEGPRDAKPPKVLAAKLKYKLRATITIGVGLVEAGELVEVLALNDSSARVKHHGGNTGWIKKDALDPETSSK
ncbi:MAG TPA: hypothetical protein VGG74_03865 [Kofleriaceae bacterium]